MPIVRRRKAGIFSLLFMGIIFAGAGGSVSWFFGGDTTLTCQRSANLCVLEETNLRGRRKVVQSFPLADLKSAEVTQNRGKKGKSTYKVTLQTKDGSIPFSGVSSSNRDDHHRRADAINSYLASNQENLTVAQSGKTIRLIGYAFLTIGLLMFLGGAWRLFKALVTLGFVLGAKG